MDSRVRGAVGVLVMALAAAPLAACGGDGDASADPPTPSTPTSDTPTADPTTESRRQPRGEWGVTYDVANWAQYRDDEAVLALKRALEVVNGSINAGEELSDYDDLLTGAAARDYRATFAPIWDGEMHVKKRADIRIASSESTKKKATVEACIWAPSASLLHPDGSVVGEDPRHWLRYVGRLRSQSAEWVLARFKFEGTCAGGAP